MLVLTESEAAYLAGIFDGEGWLGYSDKKYKKWRITISTSNDNLHAWLKLKLQENACYYTFEKRQKESHKDALVTNLNKQRIVKEFLEIILPYVIVKRERVLQALEDFTYITKLTLDKTSFIC